ncbi:hypothetical protein ACFL5V_06235 [Fibrobacterota bacterium]
MAYKETNKGLWTDDVVIKINVDGRPHMLRERQTIKGSERKAKKIEFEIRSRLEAKKAELLNSTGFLKEKFRTFGECLEEYLEQKHGSWDNYQIVKLHKEFGAIKLEELTQRFDRWFQIVKQEPIVKGTLPATSSTNKYGSWQRLRHPIAISWVILILIL